MAKARWRPSAWLGLLLPMFAIGMIAGVFLYNRSGNQLHTMMRVPAFSLQDQHGNTISDKTMLGKVYVVEFFYSSCPTICPVMNKNLQHIHRETPSDRFGIVSISIDPKNDTPTVLQEHAKKIGAEAPNWHFLTGDRGVVGNLAKKFNIYVGEDTTKTESLDHSGMLALVDQKGYLRCRYGENGVPILYYSGLNYRDPEATKSDLHGRYHPDIDALKEDIKILLTEK